MQYRDHDAEREGYVWQLWLRRTDELHEAFAYHDSYQTERDAVDAGRSWSGCEHEVRPSPLARPIPTPVSKTGLILKSKALRGDRSRAVA